MVARRVMSVKYLGIVNVMASREVVKELLQERADGPSLAAELERLLSSVDARRRLQEDLASVVAKLGGGGSHRRAAASVAAAWGDQA
jgi:lipid-A-disaccharide synthase